MQFDYIDQVKKQLEADPDNVSLQLKLGRAYYWLALAREGTALVEAEKVFGRIIERDPSNAEALAHHGSLLSLKIGFKQIPLGQLIDAARQSSEELDRAVALAPDSIEVRLLRAYSIYYTPSVVGRDQITIGDFKKDTLPKDRVADDGLYERLREQNVELALAVR